MWRHSRLWYRHITHLLGRGHSHHSPWKRIIHALDSIWNLIWWFWMTVIIGLIVGVLGNFVYSDITTSKIDFTDPHTWMITHFLLTNAHRLLFVLVIVGLLTILSYWAHCKNMQEVHKRGKNEYIL